MRKAHEVFQILIASLVLWEKNEVFKTDEGIRNGHGS